MSCIWVSAQDCSRNEIFQLTELARKDKDLRIILSYEPPAFGVEPCGEYDKIEEKLTDLLIRIGVKPNLKGYQYLKTGVKICLKDREELDGITKRLYPSIAKKHKTTADKVEHAIRHAIETSWLKGSHDEQKFVFGYCADEGKRPTNAEFITRLTDSVQRSARPLYS